MHTHCKKKYDRQEEIKKELHKSFCSTTKETIPFQLQCILNIIEENGYSLVSSSFMHCMVTSYMLFDTVAFGFFLIFLLQTTFLITLFRNYQQALGRNPRSDSPGYHAHLQCLNASLLPASGSHQTNQSWNYW